MTDTEARALIDQAIGKNSESTALLNQAKAAMSDPAPAPTPTPTPTPTTVAWGTNVTDVDKRVTTGPNEFAGQKEAGSTFPRFGSSNDPRLRQDTGLCTAAGFTKWVAILSQSKTYFPEIARANAYLKDFPNAWIEPVNEPNLGGSWTPEQLASLSIAFYKGVKAANPNATILCSGLGNSEYQSTVTPLAYLKRMVAAGFKKGNGFDVFNMHWYEPNDYYHIWTPDSKGESMLSVLGNPKFLITEFGKRSTGTSASETSQAQDCDFRMTTLKAQPLCVGGHWYSLSDDADGVGGTGWGLRRTNGTHKPAWNSFKAKSA